MSDVTYLTSKRWLDDVVKCMQGAQRRSYVPDFVRRPGAYTCYELEEPLVVGSGDNASAGAAQVQFISNEKVACSACRYLTLERMYLAGHG